MRGVFTRNSRLGKNAQMSKVAPDPRKNIGDGESKLIDDMKKTEALMEKMRVVLPISAEISAHTLEALREDPTEPGFPRHCEVTAVNYVGDEGGIVCTLGFATGEASKVLISSITHLIFDRKNPLSREIRAYQKHRIKRLRKRSGRPF